MDTRLTELLGVEHPVMLAGMGGVSYSALVAAVSGAGGFGCLGASTMRIDRMVDEMAAVRAATDRPFGVDLLTAMPGGMVDQVERIIEGGASVFVAGLGVPAEVVDLCHGTICWSSTCAGRSTTPGGRSTPGATSWWPRAPRPAGHTGQVATMPLVPQIVDAVGHAIPVVAAGGIVDGRGLAAALALGADGVWMGTRFIATPEARSVVGYKDALLRAHEDATTISRAFSGKTMRVLRNEYTRFFEDNPAELRPFPDQLGRSMQDGAWHLGGGADTPGVDPAREGYPTGQGVGAITALEPAADLVRRVVDEAEGVLAGLSRLAGR